MKITSDSQKLDSASGRGQPKNTWYFTFDLQARLPSEAGVALQLESQIQSLAYSQYRKQALTKVSIISFSSSADESPEIRGFISGKQMWRKTVQTWLTSSEISNLQLHPIADRFHDPKILSFLADSTLPMGLRLRVDAMDPSDAPRVRAGGRPRKTPGERPTSGAAGPRTAASAAGAAAGGHEYFFSRL